MQLIEYQKIEALGVRDDLAVILALSRHEQLEHHEVGQKDVGLAGANGLAIGGVILSGVARKRGPEVLGKFRLVYELLQLLHLAVSQGIHRIDDDGTGAPLLSSDARTHGSVEDGDEEAH